MKYLFLFIIEAKSENVNLFLKENCHFV